jgi:hypothetical protein
LSSSSRSNEGSLSRERVIEFSKPDLSSYRRNENIVSSSSIANTAYIPSRVSTAGMKYDPVSIKPWDHSINTNVNDKYLNLNQIQRHSTLTGPSISNRSETTLGYNPPSLGVNGGSF